MTSIANKSVEIIGIPKTTASVQCEIDFICGMGLPGFDDSSEGMAGQSFKQSVHVIGHYAPGNHSISGAIEIEKRVFNNFCKLWVFQNAFTVSGIEGSVNPLSSFIIEFFILEKAQPLAHSCKHHRRQ